MTQLRWNSAPEVAAFVARTGATHRWANADGNLTPDFTIRPGFPRLALVAGGVTYVEGDVLP